jgi:RNA polymerase sigma-70 factor, ECF subfamily
MTAAHRDADGSEFTRLWVQAQSPVGNYLATLVQEPHACDDLLQEVALACLQGFGTYDRTRPFIAWALGIARNKVLSQWRGMKRAPAWTHDSELLDSIARITEEIDDELQQRERALQQCLADVKGRAWELLERVYHRDQQPQAIANEMGLTASHVRVLLTRIRASLRACIERRAPSGVP